MIIPRSTTRARCSVKGIRILTLKGDSGYEKKDQIYGVVSVLPGCLGRLIPHAPATEEEVSAGRENTRKKGMSCFSYLLASKVESLFHIDLITDVIIIKVHEPAFALGGIIEQAEAIPHEVR